jgi:ethanolamine ammonia-lyase small subunit
MGYRPRTGHTDAERNLISNIHARGVSCEEAAQRILRLAERMMRRRLSGAAVKEEMVRGSRRIQE